MVNRHMTVKEIEKEDDRILLYSSDKRYHVIAKPDIDVKIGDEIEYEPCGVNFGWFVKMVEKV